MKAKIKIPNCRNCTLLQKQALANGYTPAQAKELRPIHKAKCLTCYRCGVCRCACVICNKCGAQVPGYRPTWCPHCKHCSKCDKCRKMPHFIHPTRMRIHDGPKHFNTLPRTIGLELEISDWGSLNEQRFQHLTFQKAHDWSVQPSGLEMVIDPFEGDKFLTGMMELGEKLYISNVKINNTCALHVHVGSSDLSYWEIRRLLRVYGRLEGEIYDHLILPHRRDEPTVVHYCQMFTRQHKACERCTRYDDQYPRQRSKLRSLKDVLADMDKVKSTAELKSELFKMLYNITNASTHRAELATRKGGRYEWCRYVGLNLHAWQYRGTVEWRMKEGTSKLDELITWPLWCGWFVEAITRMTEKDSRDEKMGLMDFTERYMPRWITRWVQDKVISTGGRG